MHIVYLAASPELGGAERVLIDAAAGLRAERPSWKVTVVVPAAGALRNVLSARGIAVDVVEMPAALASVGDYTFGRLGALAAGWSATGYARRLRLALRRLQPSVVHSNGFKMHVASALLRPRGSKVLWHLHDYVGRRPRSAGLLRRLQRGCDLIVANSRSVADDAGRVLGAARRIVPVLNGVDTARFTPDGSAADLDALGGAVRKDAEGSNELTAGPVVRVGLVGTYAKWKGHLTFIEAIAQLQRARLPVRLVAYIVGGPIYRTAGSQWQRAELEAEVQRRGLTSVRFIDFTDDTASIFRALDVVVHTSEEPEPFGLVIAEAMACGRAVVTSAIGGAAELVRPGVDALTHRPGDAATLAVAIERLATDEALRHRLGQAAHLIAIRKFARHEFVESLADLYAGLVPSASPVSESVPA